MFTQRRNTMHNISLRKQLKRVGRPKSDAPKVQLTVRYDADIVQAFKAGGEGGQARMNHALRDWLKTHQV